MKIWVDDIRSCSKDEWIWCKSVNYAIKVIENYEKYNIPIELIDLDHDAGEYSQLGGDYIKILDWLEETRRNYPIHIHSMNPVGIENMRTIIKKNGWKEVI